ncbi:hypothetical protein GCM10023194_39730 [Planotetraspora phitsanulokensis]|uniref:Uncharacterized protein n=1 Tax=Planotetraspora phitsanulokensis TaxID=575192 RepID=A0A8J3U9Z8_9ACTN|nr:hypothetical protein Pph01_65020 [Planotetraspora phitsanulokensis]
MPGARVATDGNEDGAGQRKQVITLGLVQPERSGDRVEDHRRGVLAAALFQPGVIVDADAGESCELFATQPWNASMPFALHPHVFRIEAGPARAEEVP